MASARFAWGIDVGNRALKAVKLVRDGNDQLRIDDFEVIEHEQILSQSGDNRESLVQTALANFAQHHPTRGGSVGIGVSGQSSFARFVKLPPVDPRQVPKIVGFEAKQQIPFDLAEVEWSYQTFTNPDSPDIEVGIFAMRKELVNQNIKNFTDVGVDVEIVQMTPLAVYNALYSDGRLKGTTMIIDLGAENTDLIIAEGESIWMRSIPIGGNNFTESLVKAFKLKFNKAEELKRNAATSKYGRQILQAMRPVFADLVAEIQRSIGFYTSTHRDSRISRVLALGGTFRLPGLQKYLQQNLQLDVARVDRLGVDVPADSRFASAFNENILSSVGAYGLALQAMGQGKITSSLLPEKIQRERKWREKTKWFGAAAAAFVVGSGLAVGTIYYKGVQYDNQHGEFFNNKLKKTLATAGKLDTEWKAVESAGGDERKLITNLNGAINDRSIVPDLAIDIMRAFPPASEQSLEELQKTPRSERKTILLEGWREVFSPDLTAILTKTDQEFGALKSNSFGEAGGSRSSRDRTDDLRGTAFGPRAGGAVKKMTQVTAEGAVPRGMVITVRCRTPYAGAEQLVKDTVLKALEMRKQDSPNPPQNYSVVRVVRAEVRKIDLNDRPAAALASGHVRRVLPRNQMGGAGGVGAGPGGFRGPGIVQPPGLGGAQPGGVPGQPDPWEDPLIPGESMITDKIVTLVLAVVFDPPPLKKEAPSDKVAVGQ